MGFILSLTLFPGTVWLIKVGIGGTKGQVLAVGFAFGLSQLLWLAISIAGLMMMMAHLSFIHRGMHWFAAFVLAYMAIKFFRTRPVLVLDDAGATPSPQQLFRHAFSRSLAMPMRLPSAMAVLMATGIYVNRPPSWETATAVFLGAVVGVAWWWGQFSLLSAFFAKRVPMPITLRSLNKIRPFGGLLYCFLAGIVLLFGG